MASTTRASSFLPTIKCSNCSVEIPISNMADHICAPGRLVLLTSTLTLLTRAQLPLYQTPDSKPLMDHSHLLPKWTCLPSPPRPLFRSSMPPLHVRNHNYSYNILLTRWNKVDSFLQSDGPLPSPKPIISRSASPSLSSSNRKSPFQKPSRSATTPLVMGPPSPDITISQDCAFPPFPTVKSRSTTPTTPVETTFSFPQSKPLDRTEPVSGYAPLSPQSIGGGSVLQRMDSIAPGPFKLNEKGQPRQSGHKKTSSMSSSQDFIRPVSSGGSKTHTQRPSTSSSNYTRNHSYSASNASASSRYTFDRNREEVPTIPAMPPPPRQPSHPDTTLSVENGQRPIASDFDFGTFGQERRSNTFPKEEDSSTRTEDQASFHRRPSEPSPKVHKPRPSLAAAAMQPLHEIGSTSSFNPSKSIRGRKNSQTADRAAAAATRARSASRGDARDDQRLQGAPPVPLPTNAQTSDQVNPYHTPNESTSSNDSFSSGVKSGSSRSSPPLNDSPQRSNGHSDNNRINNMFNGFQFDVDTGPAFEEPPLRREDSENGPLKPRPTNAHGDIRQPSPTPPEDVPANTPPISPDEYFVSSVAPQSNNLRVSPVPPAQPQYRHPSPRRRTTGSKGNCRGCGELIKGKSVSSADGRLTGRYHKQCFVCKTCQAPFQTADFYVMNNHPYCGRHYHELNNSLCTKCDRGIEGQYLETEQRLKFHPHCFSCQECHRILRDDFFEWNGRTLCEQHAFRAAQQPSSLGPGRRYPERRTTRLMMM